jgi:hypothetical protein
VPDRWQVELTPEARKWLTGLSERDMRKLTSPLERLTQDGPTLGWPHAEHIKGSRYHNMKELRSVGGHLRALFIFDPRRRAIVLLGGDKTNDWDGWYKRNVPLADKLYDRHLRSLGRRGSWTMRQRDSLAGEHSAVRSR